MAPTAVLGPAKPPTGFYLQFAHAFPCVRGVAASSATVAVPPTLRAAQELRDDLGTVLLLHTRRIPRATSRRGSTDCGSEVGSPEPSTTVPSVRLTPAPRPPRPLTTAVPPPAPPRSCLGSSAQNRRYPRLRWHKDVFRYGYVFCSEELAEASLVILAQAQNR